MRTWLRYAGAALAASAFLHCAAQSESSSRPKFEVVSIKECKPDDRPSPSISSPGRLGLGCWPLWRLIAEAYDTFATGKVDPLKLLVPQPLQGAPDWAKSARYSVDAKAESPQTGAMMRGPMMQALLEDRFQLKVRRETREVEGYLMTVAKGGLKMRPTEEGSCHHADPTDLAQSPKTPDGKPWCVASSVTRNGPLTVFDVHGMTLEVFARLLHPDGRTVIDRTGATGPYDIHLEFEDEAPHAAASDQDKASDPSPHASAITATREQLGLRLTPGKGTIELLVIDRIARPSGN